MLLMLLHAVADEGFVRLIIAMPCAEHLHGAARAGLLVNGCQLSCMCNSVRWGCWDVRGVSMKVVGLEDQLEPCLWHHFPVEAFRGARKG
jgi:hypothetical protein